MKTTVEMPDVLFRRAKSKAAERGQTLKEFVTEALREKLDKKGAAESVKPAFMQGFGKLRMLHKETGRIQKSIQEAFEVLEPEDRA